MIAVLCGGVGAAKLLAALRTRQSPDDVIAIVNVGDDVVLHGLTICPDLDSIMYKLAGLNNEELGWGLRGETWRVRDELAALGGEAWFALGDRDLATHLYRSERLARGATKAEVTNELVAKFQVPFRLVPVTNDPVQTSFDTAVGPLSFQEYFVRHHHDVRVDAIHVNGAAAATLHPEARAALASARTIVLAPSNPLISIDPILAIPGVRDQLIARRSDVVAVSPIVGGEALKGPAARLMRERGLEATALGVARYYRDIVGTFVLDEVDRALADDVAALGLRVVVANTIMGDPAVDAHLAEVVCA